jgi:hypothetical protein
LKGTDANSAWAAEITHKVSGKVVPYGRQRMQKLTPQRARCLVAWHGAGIRLSTGLRCCAARVYACRNSGYHRTTSTPRTVCALAAKLVASGDVQDFGQQQEGFIVIPRLRGEAATCDSSEHIYCLKHCPHVVKNHSLVKANETPACCFMLALYTSKLPRTPPTPPRFAFV